jgi:transposase
MRATLAEREDLARRKEQWILRTAQGEDPERVRQALHLKPQIVTLARLRARYVAAGRTWQALLERRHGRATKGTPAVKAFVAKAKAKHPQLTAADLVAQIWDRFEIEISRNRLSTLLKQAGLSNPVGHPPGVVADGLRHSPEGDVDHAGAFFPPGGAQRPRRARGHPRRA